MIKTLLTIAGLLLNSACSPTYKVPSRLDTSLLRATPVEQQKLVLEAKAEGSAARSAYRDARAETETMGGAVTRARQELRVVVAAVDEACVALAAARKKATQPALSEAQAEYDELLGMGRIARYALAVARREHELAALGERLALEESRFADARVETVRGTALGELDLRPEQNVPLEDLREQALFHEREVEVMRRRLSDAGVRLSQARRDYDAAILESKRAASAGRR